MIMTSEYNYCSNRLPCGVCRLTNSQCPKVPYNTTITCGPYCNSTVPTTSTTTTATINSEAK